MSIRAIPLCVDLDSCLLRTDLLLESFVDRIGRGLPAALRAVLALRHGKAALKASLADGCEVDIESLPINQSVLSLATTAHQQGRRVVLCTGSDRGLAELAARRFSCFDEVLASEPGHNLSGHAKAKALVDRFGERGFDYVGDSSVDLHVWERARGAIVVGSDELAQAAATRCELLAQIDPCRGGVRTLIHAIRLHQWLKNLLVFVPLLAAHRALDIEAVISATLAFIAFGLCASGVYLINDLLDLDADRRHPRKRLRPMAAGTLPLLHGLLAAPLLVLAALGLAALVSLPFLVVLSGYFLLTLAYSLRLKRTVMLDVILLAFLYTTRIVGGTAAIGSELSFWLLAFSMFIFLSLAMLKRYTELNLLLSDGRIEARGRGYRVDDLPLLQSLGGSAGYCAVLVLALYIDSPDSRVLYQQPYALWSLCPLILYWISRAWMLAHRGEMDDDPVVFASTDRFSLGIAALCLFAVLVAL